MPKAKTFAARPCRKCKKDFVPARKNGALCDECRGAKRTGRAAGPSLAAMLGEAIQQHVDARLTVVLAGAGLTETLRPLVRPLVEEMLRELIAELGAK